MRYINPPDSLLTQLNLYAQEKCDDEEDVRERSQHFLRETKQFSERLRSEPEAALQDLVLLARQHDSLYPIMVDILRHYGQIFQRDIGMYAIFLLWNLLLKSSQSA